MIRLALVFAALTLFAPSAHAEGWISCVLRNLGMEARSSVGPQEEIWALAPAEAHAKENMLAFTLTHAPLSDMRHAGSGMYNAQRARIRAPVPFDAIIKDQNPRGEVAAYVLDRLLGLGKVPVTALRTSGGRELSAQVFVRAERSATGPEMRTLLYDADLRAFDFLIQNTDRNSGNLLILPEGKAVAIDHGGAQFRQIFRLDEYFPPGLRARPSQAFLDALRALNAQSLQEKLGSILTEAQRQHILQARDQLIARFP